VQNGDLDPNEFASGRGRTQFMDFAFVQNPVVARTVPYSTLAVGGSWQPAKDTTVTTMLANLDDSSTTSGFEDIGDGAVAIVEADFQWPGTLPGGVNVGGTYAFDGEFTKLGDQLQFSPGATPTLRTDEESWSVYGSAWQYMAVRSKVPDRIDPKDGRPDVEGYGWFTRFGMADRDTNPIDWSLSFGIGGRGTVGGRTDDGYGFGWFYSDLQQPRPLLVSLLADHTSGFEAWYDFALARSTSVTVDAQWVDSAFHGINDAFILGFRFSARL
jgi:porin